MRATGGGAELDEVLCSYFLPYSFNSGRQALFLNQKTNRVRDKRAANRDEFCSVLQNLIQ